MNWKRMYYLLVASALRDRKNPRYREEAERWLLRFGPVQKTIQ